MCQWTWLPQVHSWCFWCPHPSLVRSHKWALLLFQFCAIQASQSVQDRLSIEVSSGSPPTAHWFQLVLYVLEVGRSTVAIRCFFNSLCIFLRVEPSRWIMLMAAAESQQSICDNHAFGSSVSRTQNFKANATTASAPFPRTLHITQQQSGSKLCAFPARQEAD